MLKQKNKQAHCVLQKINGEENSLEVEKLEAASVEKSTLTYRKLLKEFLKWNITKRQDY